MRFIKNLYVLHSLIQIMLQLLIEVTQMLLLIINIESLSRRHKQKFLVRIWYDPTLLQHHVLDYRSWEAFSLIWQFQFFKCQEIRNEQVPIQRLFSHFPFNNSNKMRSNSKTQLTTTISQQEPTFYQLQFGQAYLDRIHSLLHKDRTSSADVPLGEWRTNIMLEDSAHRSINDRLSLRHLTSFEEKSMENHGKILKKAWENYLGFIRSPSFQTQFKQITFDEQTEVCQALCLIADLKEDKKTGLLEFSKGKIQAQLVLKQILRGMGSQYYISCLSIAKEIFDCYETFGVENMEEEQIINFVDSHHQKLGEIMKEFIDEPRINSDNPEDELHYLQMIRVWMQTIFFALNGVFQNPDDRKTAFEELQGYETFFTARKLAKMD